MSNLRETFLEELKDLYDAEKQLIKALPKMTKAARHDDLMTAFEMHLEETEEQVGRLEKIFKLFGEHAKAKKCRGMEGLIEECREQIENDEGDAALICAAQKMEHYEIASYGSLTSWGRLLEQEEAVEFLEQSLNEEEQADEKLTQIAESIVNPEEAEEVGTGMRGRGR
jgi:ferritin-like metal-binding protein YciE